MEIVNESNCKQNKLWLIKEENFTINLCKNGQKNNDILIYLAHNERTSVIAERFIKTLKAKTYKQ